MTTRDTRRAFLRLLDETWPGVRSEFVAAMRQARAGVDMRALEDAIARGDVDAAFRALRFARFSTRPAAHRLPAALCSHSEAGMSGPNVSRGIWAQGW